MKTFLLRWWRWQAKHLVRACLKRDDVTLYITRWKLCRDNEGRKRIVRYFWDSNAQDFTPTEVLSGRYTDPDIMLHELSNARWSYIWDKIRKVRLDRFENKLKKY